MEELFYDTVIHSNFSTVEDVNDCVINFEQETDYYPILIPLVYNENKKIDNIKSFYSEFTNICLFDTIKHDDSFTNVFNISIDNSAFNHEYTYYKPNYITCNVEPIDSNTFNVIIFTNRDLMPSEIVEDYFILFVKITNKDDGLTSANLVNDFNLSDYETSNTSFKQDNFIKGVISYFNHEHYINWVNYSVKLREVYYDSKGFYDDIIQNSMEITIPLDENGVFKHVFVEEEDVNFKLLPGVHDFSISIVDNNDNHFKSLGIVSLEVLKEDLALRFDREFVYREIANFDVEFVLPDLDLYYTEPVYPDLWLNYNFNFINNDDYNKIKYLNNKYKHNVSIKREYYDKRNKKILGFIYNISETLFSNKVTSNRLDIKCEVCRPRDWNELVTIYNVVNNTDYFDFQSTNDVRQIDCSTSLNIRNKDLTVTCSDKTGLTPYLNFSNESITNRTNYNVNFYNLKIISADNAFLFHNGTLTISNCEIDYSNEFITCFDNAYIKLINNTLFNCLNDFITINGGSVLFEYNKVLLNELTDKSKNVKAILFNCVSGELKLNNNIIVVDIRELLEFDIGYKIALFQAKSDFIINDNLVEDNQFNVYFLGKSNQIYYYVNYHYFHKRPEKVTILVPYRVVNKYGEYDVAYKRLYNVKYEDYVTFELDGNKYSIDKQPLYNFSTNKLINDHAFVCVLNNNLIKTNLCECFSVIARNLNYDKYDKVNNVDLNHILIPFKTCCEKNQSNNLINKTRFPSIEFKGNLNFIPNPKKIIAHNL